MELKIELLTAHQDSWWHQFAFQVEERLISVYYHITTDSYQVICDDKELAAEIFTRLRKLNSELTEPAQIDTLEK